MYQNSAPRNPEHVYENMRYTFDKFLAEVGVVQVGSFSQMEYDVIYQ